LVWEKAGGTLGQWVGLVTRKGISTTLEKRIQMHYHKMFAFEDGGIYVAMRKYSNANNNPWIQAKGGGM
jgi:hypothetical protein